MAGERSMSWKKVKRLGNGSFGTVYFANSPTLSSFAAVKTADWNDCWFLQRECRFLRELRGNPFVVECFAADISQEGGEWYYNVLMEHATGGSLDDIIRGFQIQIMPEPLVAYYSYLLLRGLSEIHRKGIVHCDIKPSNILVFKNRHGRDHLKLADFGLAKYERENDTGEFRGTLDYASPESLKHGSSTKAADVWSFGMTVLEMMSGGRPIWGKSIKSAELMDLIVTRGAPEIPDHVSKHGNDFLNKCLSWNSECRWSAERLLKHPFISENVKGIRFESRDVVNQKHPFGSWISTRGLFSTSGAIHRPVRSEYELISKSEIDREDQKRKGEKSWRRSSRQNDNIPVDVYCSFFHRRP